VFATMTDIFVQSSLKDWVDGRKKMIYPTGSEAVPFGLRSHGSTEGAWLYQPMPPACVLESPAIQGLKARFRPFGWMRGALRISNCGNAASPGDPLESRIPVAWLPVYFQLTTRISASFFQVLLPLTKTRTTMEAGRKCWATASANEGEIRSNFSPKSAQALFPRLFDN
jgi:hypothetical protein